MNMLLFITSFKISAFPLAENFEKKMLKYLRLLVNRLILLSRNFEEILNF